MGYSSGDVATLLFRRACEAFALALSPELADDAELERHVDAECIRYDAELAALGYRLWFAEPEGDERDRPTGEPVATEIRDGTKFLLFRK